MGEKERIESCCPECNTKSLFLRDNDIYCHQCEKVIFHEIPKTPEGKQKIISAIEHYLKEATKMNQS